MHTAPAPRINKNNPAVMAARLSGYLAGVQSYGDRLIEPAPTQRDIREAERDAHPEHVKHLKLRFAEGIPRIISRQSVDLLTHIRRVEYQLRCFILWLAAILVEKAQKNPENYSSLFPAKAGISRNMPDPDPRLRGDERGSLGDSQVTTQAQRDQDEVEGFARAETKNPEQISDFVWSQELEMRRLAAKTFPIGGFSITTPVIEGKRRARRSRMRHLTPDCSRTVDASYLVARLARLPRILARADQMAERLAKKALTAGFEINQFDPHLDPPLSKAHEERNRSGESNSRMRRRITHRPIGSLGKALPLKKGEMEGDRNGSYIPTISVSMARTPIPNPLYFEPLTRIVPPDKLWNSTEDDEERGDMTWLHFIASDTLSRTGHAPGPDAGSYLPDLSRFEPPKPPQVRGT